MGERQFGRYRVELSNETKVFFPDSGLTKGDLIGYYERIADVMLPHLDSRPLTLHRFPDGIRAEGFYQQARAEYFPEWLEGLEVDHGGETGTIRHVLCPHSAALVYLANQATVTFHAWLSRTAHLDRPDRIIFDLDPPGKDFAPVREGARLVRAGMEEAGLTPFVMTTGSRGLHVVAPLRPETDFDNIREAAAGLAGRLADAHPDTLTTEQRKNKRGNRLYLDIMRNAFGQTAVAPYAVRAKPGAPVATPLEWHELEDPDLGPQRYTLANIFRRLGQREDPWAGIDRHAVSPRHLIDAVR